MPLLEALLWSGLEPSDSNLNRIIGSEPGLRGELPASGAQMPLLEGLLWSGLERSRQDHRERARLARRAACIRGIDALLEALLWSGLERSDKNKDNLF